MAWGDANNGGLIPPAKVSELYPPCLTVGLGGGSIAELCSARDTSAHPLNYLRAYSPAQAALLGSTVAIYANAGAFVAIAADGSVVTWGDDDAGGDSSAVAAKLVNVQSISHSGSAFTAMCRST